MKQECNSEHRKVRDYDGLGEKECMQNIGEEISWERTILKTVNEIQGYY
jgi:hypothetical protein